jgi:hypothetical protein
LRDGALQRMLPSTSRPTRADELGTEPITHDVE